MDLFATAKASPELSRRALRTSQTSIAWRDKNKMQGSRLGTESILIGIELVCACHGDAERRQRVQDADGVAMRCQNLREALVAVRRLIDASATQDYVGPRQPVVHHMRLDQTLALDGASLAIDDPSCLLTTEDTTRTVNRAVQRSLLLE